jgi:hypothetical protein
MIVAFSMPQTPRFCVDNWGQHTPVMWEGERARHACRDVLTKHTKTLPARPSGKACFLCPYIPYKCVKHRKMSYHNAVIRPRGHEKPSRVLYCIP